MTKTPAVRGLLAGFVLLIGTVTQASAQAPAPGQMLDPKLAPKQEDVSLTVPTGEELKNCSVKLVKGANPGSSGWLLIDAKEQPVRRFFDSNGDGKVDIWSYFKDGVEVYREFDTTLKAGIPNNFRWLNSNGMKWGVGGVDSRTGKGYIEAWRMISAEEVGYEAYQAVVRQDFARLSRLFITDAEVQALKLSPASIKRITAAQQTAQKKFADITKAVDWANTKFERVEGHPASCTLEESAAGENNVIRYQSRPILYKLGENKLDWLHTGELIQVGMAWRLVEVPNDRDPVGGGGGPMPPPSNNDPRVAKLYAELEELDKRPPAIAQVLAKNAEVETYYRKRIDLVQKIAALDKADQRETWDKQLFDNLASLAQNSGDSAIIDVLKQFKDDVVAKKPGSNVAAYGTYRHMWTGYAITMAKLHKDGADQKAVSAIQDKWFEQLGDFVKKYSKADDTPDVLIQLATGCEYSGKDEEAKRWYTTLYDTFPEHTLTPRARGSVARLNLLGREFKLTAPLLADANKLFDVAQLKGKVVIVHYWASYSNNYKGDFAQLKRILDEVGKKNGVELVSINLDDAADIAKASLKTVSIDGTHLFQTPPNNSGGGMNSPLATQYGIHMLPTVIMVGRDGRVTNRSLQIADIETELKKVQ